MNTLTNLTQIKNLELKTKEQTSETEDTKSLKSGEEKNYLFNLEITGKKDMLQLYVNKKILLSSITSKIDVINTKECKIFVYDEIPLLEVNEKEGLGFSKMVEEITPTITKDFLIVFLDVHIDKNGDFLENIEKLRESFSTTNFNVNLIKVSKETDEVLEEIVIKEKKRYGVK